MHAENLTLFDYRMTEQHRSQTNSFVWEAAIYIQIDILTSDLRSTPDATQHLIRVL